jgi:hypothetical protein
VRCKGAPEAANGALYEVVALGTAIELGHILHMKLNSPESIQKAAKVFRSYGGSWTAAREAGHRDNNGVLVIPAKHDGKDGRHVEAGLRIPRKAG